MGEIKRSCPGDKVTWKNYTIVLSLQPMYEHTGPVYSALCALVDSNIQSTLYDPIFQTERIRRLHRMHLLKTEVKFVPRLRDWSLLFRKGLSDCYNWMRQCSVPRLVCKIMVFACICTIREMFIQWKRKGWLSIG